MEMNCLPNLNSNFQKFSGFPKQKEVLSFGAKAKDTLMIIFLQNFAFN